MKSLRTHDAEIPAPRVILRQRGCSDGHKPCCLLIREYVYYDGDTEIRIPKRFHYDGASVPKFLHSLIGPFDLSDVGVLLHDFLYRFKGRVPYWCMTPYRPYTRAQADALFKRVMDQLGVPEWRENAGYFGVRAGGWNAWRKGQAAT